jgi:two-component system response regulator AtoC
MVKPVLVVDDDRVMRNLLAEVLSKQGYGVVQVSDGESAIERIEQEEYPVIVSDIRMLDLGGVDVLRKVKRRWPLSCVILMTGFGSMEGAIEAVQEGAFDYISKPFPMDDFKALVSRAFKQWELARSSNEEVTSSRPLEARPKALIGSSPKIVEVYKLLARAAMSSSTVLVRGESGTGKELVARAIHQNSARKGKPFVAVNCGAIAENLLESELFGHVRGSFTGAVQDKRGLFEEASGGTLFLDEIGDLPIAMQVKLLRVLQEGEVRPVGGNETRKVDVRLIAATHRNLDELVASERFREDLYYRLKVISIELPPLRERLEDLPELVSYFLAKFAARNSRPVSHVSDEGMARLRAYAWPGNVRELEHAIERAVAMSNSTILFPEDFDLAPGTEHSESVTPTAVLADASLEDLEKNHILRVLQETQYNKSKASEILGIDRATLYRKAQRYGIDLRKE